MPENTPKKVGRPVALISLILFVLWLWYLWGGGLERQATTSMQGIENKVAADAVEQYWIAFRQGDKMQICVQAGLVSAAFLQAKDESNYRVWKDTEKRRCAAAGVSQ
jgi:hypothetical protein